MSKLDQLVEELLDATREAFEGVVEWAQRKRMGKWLGNGADDAKVLLFPQDARVNYLLALPDDAAAQVETLIDVAYLKHGLLMTPKEVELCLVRARDGQFVGAVAEVNLESGLVFQSIGRGRGAIHCIADLGRVPEVGESLDVTYRAGRGVERPSHTATKNYEVSR